MRVLYYIKNPWVFFISLAAKLEYFKGMDDELYLKFLYKARLGQKLDLKYPKTFNEKLQWLKLYNRNPEYTAMVDKYMAKRYVADKIGEQYIVPTLGVWECVDDIDFATMPNRFVLKSTHDCGVVICKDKNNFDVEEAREKLRNSLKNDYWLRNREWPYKNVSPKILAEQYMAEDSDRGLIDYKFYCFQGKPQFLYVSTGLENHETAAISFLTLDWEFAPYKRPDYMAFKKLPRKPYCYEKMLELATVLAENLPFVRVDLYEVRKQIYFSELTFFPSGGFMLFKEEEHDLEIGKMLEIP